MTLDDSDVIQALKNHVVFDDSLLSYLSEGILDRRLFRSQLSTRPFAEGEPDRISRQIQKSLGIDEDTARQLIFSGTETTRFYDWKPNQIHFLMKDGRTRSFEEVSDLGETRHLTTKYYLVYPKVDSGSSPK